MWSDRLRESLYPLLVVSIVGTLWVVGRAGEMEADSQYTFAPTPEWHALQERLRAQDARASLAD